MSAEARKKAERCFAVARSTTFDGERENAIAQGTRIAEAAGLNLDTFDIPGRVKAKPTPTPRPSPDYARARTHGDPFDRYYGAGSRFTSDMFEDILRSDAFRRNYSANAQQEAERMREQQRRHEEARRRADETLREQARGYREGINKRALHSTATKVATALIEKGWRVYPEAAIMLSSSSWRVLTPKGEDLGAIGAGALCGVGLEEGLVELVARGLANAR